MLVDPEQRGRLEQAASARGTSVATILAAPPMAVPDVSDLLEEMDALRGRNLG